MWSEYRRSLKMPDAEELFDLLFYRPAAFLLVKLVYRTRLTPNQITVFSMLAGLIAAWDFSTGYAFVAGGIWYAIANVLDCADGQLARLQNSGTLLGRVVDGVADYISSIAIFLGIGAGLVAMGKSEWLLVVVAGLSSALHALFFDHYQNEYISIVRGKNSFLDGEIAGYTDQINLMKKQYSLRRLVMVVYLRYLKFQQRTSTRSPVRSIDPELYQSHNRPMIRWWSFLGPTTNHTILIGCAFAGRLDFYLWTILIIGNAWLLLCVWLQRNIHRRMA